MAAEPLGGEGLQHALQAGTHRRRALPDQRSDAFEGDGHPIPGTLDGGAGIGRGKRNQRGGSAGSMLPGDGG